MPGKILFLISEAPPYEPGEEFLNEEFPVLLKNFDRIIILYHSQKGSSHNFPPQVELIHFPYLPSRKDKIHALRFLFSGMFWTEIREMVFRYGLFPSRQRVASILGGFAVGKKLSNLLDTKSLLFKDFKVYGYSYWCNFMAIGLAMWRRRTPSITCICRAHGYDLYFERSPTKYIPLRRMTYQSLDRVYFISQIAQAYAVQKTGSFPSMKVSYLGTAPLVHRRSAVRTHDRPLELVSCSSLIPLKRIDLIVRALALTRPGLRFNWIHFGDGPLLAQLEALSMELLSTRKEISVTFKGYVSNLDVLKHYSGGTTDVIVNVSESEGLPFSIIEAFSAGIPALATDVGGVKELVKNNETGVLLPTYPSPQDVAAQLEVFAGMSPEAWKKMSEKTYQFWESQFVAEKNYSEFVRDFM